MSRRLHRKKVYLRDLYLVLLSGFLFSDGSEHDNQDMKHLQIKLLLYFISSGLYFCEPNVLNSKLHLYHYP